MSLIESIDRLTRAIETAQVNAIEGTPLAELTERQLLQLETIKDLHNPTAGELAKSLKVSKPSITAIIDRFEKKGLVRRVAEDRDRRTLHIHLTDEGIKLTEMHRDIHRKIGVMLTSPLTDNEAAQLQILLEKMHI